MTKDEVKTDIQKFSAIDAISNTIGGKIIITSLQKDVVFSIDELISKYKTISHIEMIALCARLSERITLLRVLNKAKKLKKLAQEEMKFLISGE